MSQPILPARRPARRRAFLAVAAAVALTLTTLTTASATGPGAWDHVGPGTTASTLNGSTYALLPRGTDLYVGGAFLNAGGHDNADFLARWDGAAWRTVGTRLNGSVKAIAYYDGQVIVGGVFTDAGGNAAVDYLARLGANGWEPVCTTTGPAFSGSVSALKVVGSTLYIGGVFQDGARLPSADYLVACDLVTGTPTSTVANEFDALNGVVYALAADSAGNLYAGGGFNNVTGAPTADRVAYLDTGASGAPGSWHSMGSTGGTDGALTGFVRALTARGTDVYVGTDALDVAGIPQADHVARWNGSTWSAVGSNTAETNGWFPSSAYIYGMTTYDDILFVTGSFQDANGNPAADNVAYYDLQGDGWRALGSNGAGNGPWVGNGLALAGQHGAAIAGGSFTSAGGDTKAQHLAEFFIKRPDAYISGDSGFAGENVYSATGVGERMVNVTARGRTTAGYIFLSNKGLRDDTFTVVGGRSGDGYTVTYWTGSIDVTSEVKQGTFSRDVPRGSYRVFRVRVEVAANAAKSHSILIRIKGSATRPADAVILKVKVP